MRNYWKKAGIYRRLWDIQQTTEISKRSKRKKVCKEKVKQKIKNLENFTQVEK